MKTKERKEGIRKEFPVNNNESQKESEEMTSQSKAKEVAESAIKTLATKNKKRQEAIAVEEDAQKIKGLGMDVKK